MLDIAARSDACPPMTDDELARAIDTVVAQVGRNLPTFTYAAQNHSSVNNFYPAVPNEQWTAGFWPGSIWLAYEATDDKVLRYAAQIHVQSFLHRIENRIATDHHDMGFLYSPSSVAAWKLTGDEDGRGRRCWPPTSFSSASTRRASSSRPGGRWASPATTATSSTAC